MTQDSRKQTDAEKQASQFASTVRDSAQQIWLAGLGAFAKAQEEGSKVFDTLVKEGTTLQRKTQSSAEEKFAEATTRMSSMANDFGSRAAGQWGKLENLFEERVARALEKMGMPAASDVAALEARIAALEKALAAKQTVTRSKAGSTVKTPARATPKAPAKTPAKKAATATAPSATRTRTRTPRSAG